MYHAFQDILFLEVYRPFLFQVDQLTWREKRRGKSVCKGLEENPHWGQPVSVWHNERKNGKVKMNPGAGGWEGDTILCYKNCNKLLGKVLS